MERPCSSFVVIPFISCMAFLILVSCNNGTVFGQQFPAMFVFGDSLVDCGNNNYLTSLARANYVPYGIDFFSGPTGRFCNGKTTIDLLGDILGLPLLPPFATTFADRRNILTGVNYASAAAGILDESGKNLGDRFSLSQQVENFKATLGQLRNIISDESKLQERLEKSLVVMNLGNNDYINNYLVPSSYSSSSIYNPQQYADLLIHHYTTHITVLYNLGLRKFLLAGIGPLGCTPNQLSTGLAQPGKCVSHVNYMAQLFNNRLVSLVDQLNSLSNHSTTPNFVYGNTYGVFTEILNNPDSYGFTVTDRGCCGIGRNRGQITCLPFSVPCFNREQHIFWDAYHPTQAFNEIVAQRAYSGGTSDCYPINVKQMAMSQL